MEGKHFYTTTKDEDTTRKEIVGAHVKEKKIDELERITTAYLNDLGLSWDLIKDKRTLDIGSGIGDLGLMAKQKGISVVSVDKFPEDYEQRGEVYEGIDFVKADVRALPFTDNMFDYVVSHAAPPMVTPTREEFIAEMEELIRVVKDGGEIRLWPSRVFPGVIREELSEKNYNWGDHGLFNEGKNELARLFKNVEFRKTQKEVPSANPWHNEYIVVRKKSTDK